MRNLLLSLLVLVALPSAKVFACACAPMDQRVQQNYDNSVDVFMGIPTSSKEVVNSRFKTKNQTTFKVISSFKGEGKEVIAHSWQHPNSCGIGFEPESGVYLVFTYLDGYGELQTSSCSAAAIDPRNETVTSALKQLADIVAD